MTKRRIDWSPDARLDMDDLKRGIEQTYGTGSADGLLARIQKAIVTLSENPKFGAMRPDLVVGIRTWPVRPYIVVYFPLSDGVVIARIVHGARDLRAALGLGP